MALLIPDYGMTDTIIRDNKSTTQELFGNSVGHRVPMIDWFVVAITCAVK